MGQHRCAVQRAVLREVRRRFRAGGGGIGELGFHRRGGGTEQGGALGEGVGQGGGAGAGADGVDAFGFARQEGTPGLVPVHGRAGLKKKY